MRNSAEICAVVSVRLPVATAQRVADLVMYGLEHAEAKAPATAGKGARGREPS